MTSLDPKIQALMAAAQKPVNISAIILGPQDAGKTVLAASVSAKFPEVLPAKEPVSLDDIAWIGADKHSLQGLRMLGINVPYAVDMNGLLSEGGAAKDVQEALNLSMGAIREFVLKGGCKYVVIDTISAIDTLFCDFANKTATGPAAYGLVAKLHQQLAGIIRLPAHTIFLSHQKAVIAQAADGKRETEEAKKNYQEQEGIEDGDLDMAFYFKGLKTLYQAHASIMWELRNDYQGVGNSAKKVRILYTDRRGARTKNKYAHLTKAQEEPNLRKVFTKCGII